MNEVSLIGNKSKYKVKGKVTNIGSDLTGGDDTILEIYADLNNNGALESETDTLLRASSYSWKIREGQSKTFVEMIDITNSPFDPNTAFLLTFDKEADTLGVSTQCMCDSISVTALRDVVLPVEWGAFQVRHESYTGWLSWSTVRETNTDYFSVQRSTDKEQFMEIGQVPAAGMSDSIRSYTFADKELGSLGVATAYYRIQQIDLNGTYSMSHTRSINLSQQATPLSLLAFPSPASHTIHVQCQGMQEASKLEVISSLGNSMMEQSVDQDFWRHAHSIDVSKWPQGVYIVKVSNETQKLMYKFVKK